MNGATPPEDAVRSALNGPVPDEPPLTGNWTVYRTTEDGSRIPVESGLPEEIARQMVADYAAEGDTTLEAVQG